MVVRDEQDEQHGRESVTNTFQLSRHFPSPAFMLELGFIYFIFYFRILSVPELDLSTYLINLYGFSFSNLSQKARAKQALFPPKNLSLDSSARAAPNARAVASGGRGAVPSLLLLLLLPPALAVLISRRDTGALSRFLRPAVASSVREGGKYGSPERWRWRRRAYRPRSRR